MNWKRLVMMQCSFLVESSFLDTVGYGMYTISESKEMRQLEKKERWVFPCLGPAYDREYFCDRIASICK